MSVDTKPKPYRLNLYKLWYAYDSSCGRFGSSPFKGLDDTCETKGAIPRNDGCVLRSGGQCLQLLSTGYGLNYMRMSWLFLSPGGISSLRDNRGGMVRDGPGHSLGMQTSYNCSPLNPKPWQTPKLKVTQGCKLESRHVFEGLEDSPRPSPLRTDHTPKNLREKEHPLPGMLGHR